VARFRLRFLLQEFDVVGPEVTIGRSPDCHITIEDPLVSRRHARIRITADGQAHVSDLESRNGVRVNGTPVPKGTERALVDGDRIRLGTQELVFSVARGREQVARTTGFMRVCRQCGTPYPEGSPACPHCGAAAVQEDDTISGLVVEPRRSWTLQLLGEVLERALAMGRAAEAERIMQRAMREIDERAAARERIEPAQLETVSGYALRVAALTGEPTWARRVLDLHRAQGQGLASSTVERLAELGPGLRAALREDLAATADWYRQSAASGASVDLGVLARVEQLLR
jgi:RNA polymerase subunit RPABC4/transcription elongation factor Spt4